MGLCRGVLGYIQNNERLNIQAVDDEATVGIGVVGVVLDFSRRPGVSLEAPNSTGPGHYPTIYI